jgi:putative redox protein
MSESSVNRQEAAVDPGLVVVRREGGLANKIIVGAHHLAADEPAPIGNDTGPTPYGLLAAALGACTSMTLTMYADRKQWPLESVTVLARHGKIHASDCEDCESTECRVDRIDTAIELGGPLTDEQRERLLDVATRCPVHRTLKSEIDIQTRLV